MSRCASLRNVMSKVAAFTYVWNDILKKCMSKVVSVVYDVKLDISVVNDVNLDISFGNAVICLMM